MDRQRIEGDLKKTTGTIKENAGKAMGNRHLETEGKAEKAEAESGAGSVKLWMLYARSSRKSNRAPRHYGCPAGLAPGGVFTPDAGLPFRVRVQRRWYLESS